MEVEIHITNDYTESEQDSMVKELEELGFEVSSIDTSLIKKGAAVPPDVMLVLQFLLALAVYDFVSGFFKQMGAQTWNLIIEGLMRLFNTKKDQGNPRLKIKIPISNSTFILCSIIAENEEELKEALITLPKFIESSALRIDEVDYFIPVYYNPDDKWFIPGPRSSEEK